MTFRVRPVVRGFRRPMVLLAGVALAGTSLAAGAAAANAAPPKPPTGHHFSAAAKSFVGATTVPDRVAKLEAAMSALPKESTAYQATKLWNEGITGAGSTVATLVSFGDDKVKEVLDQYSQKHGLPPANVEILQPSGPVPACTDPGVNTSECQSWGGETDLDVTMMHAMAPNAKIVVAATPIAETQGFTGLPEMMHAVDYLAQHRIADVISMSFGTTEENFPSFSSIKTLDPALDRATRAGVTMVASSGDDGPTGAYLQGPGNYPYRVASWPASDPRVTTLGGTQLHLDAKGNRTKPDDLVTAEKNGFSEGAGLSKAYARPSWQNGVKEITGSKMRSFPDISMEGVQGTSQSAPLFAGVLALAVQANHGRLGQINPALYTKLGPSGTAAGVIDVTEGDNSQDGVTGFKAAPGFDIASGWGTVDALVFVPSLVNALH
ncbi:subtilase family protein [Amycolatopsis sulphurea]|uniref:Subtilase family protein n=1 Tax=Amycolatopsis sulphurea TaxID=76022 RepID=A0A2A9FG77_9PSEU|nr:S53 family peptidase [Amycolatopsis sulphurea]PFG49429.1 subtilase family protein [Amycolatopsis sulphurea]